MARIKVRATAIAKAGAWRNCRAAYRISEMMCPTPGPSIVAEDFSLRPSATRLRSLLAAYRSVKRSQRRSTPWRRVLTACNRQASVSAVRDAANDRYDGVLE